MLKRVNVKSSIKGHLRQTSDCVASRFRERAIGTKSCSVIGYPSGQDGAILPARAYPLCTVRKISLKAK